MTQTDENTVETDAAAATGLWAGDTGVLGEQARRALLELIKGPYLSGVKSPALWSALLADEAGIRSRLDELFLELVVDRVGEFAFVRNVSSTELKVPSAVRSAALTFLDTAMLLVLRQMLLAGEGEGRVIVGRDDVFEQLRVYRTVDRDESDFAKRLNSSWLNMKNKLRVIHQAGADDRAEISPVLRLIVDAEQIQAIGAEYRRIAAAGGAVPMDAPDDERDEPNFSDDRTDSDTDIDSEELTA
ncbi:DUF4194 domain-containing protein [Cryobacterium sp. PH29-G1]|uniref:DUF4194 domain-containing protein n=1 Tax=Cryobacterium sp. PH29-G1 TaxID=3046211 RepID=UPI0024BB4CC6|nr:DUF4194 domain-containing protein [Cryobacterium sp. PH29-G1]MDJ0349538.1 DUF4194 domain-containing protein [Cryobacterium sp. PH29-G1]